jgi:cofilin
MRVEKKIKWIVFKINNEGTEVVVEKSSENADWEQFREHLINAQHPNKKV